MKQLLHFTLLLLSINLFAQTNPKSPFWDIEKKPRMIYLPGYEYMYDAHTKVNILGWVYDRKLGKLVEMLPEENTTLHIIKAGSDSIIVNKEYYFTGKTVESKLDTFNVDSTEKYIYNEQTVNRFMSVDPLTKSFPWYTPYQFAGNMPIWATDLDGKEELIVIRWYDDGKYSGQTTFRIANKDDRKVGEYGAIYTNMDVSMRTTVNDEFMYQDKSKYQDRFFDANGNAKVGVYENKLRNACDDEVCDLLLNTDNPKATSGKALVTQTVYFSEGSSAFTPVMTVDGKQVNNQMTLDETTNTLNKNPDWQANVVGSANTNQLSPTYDNNKLSSDRASTVTNLLNGNGANIPFQNVSGIGANSNEQGSTQQGTLEKNRNAKVEFTVPLKGPIE